MMTNYPKFPFCHNPWLFTLVMDSFQEAMNGIILPRHSHYWWLDVRKFSPSFSIWTWHYIYLRRFLFPWLPDNLCVLSRWNQACRLYVRLFVCLFTKIAMIPSVVVSCGHLSSSIPHSQCFLTCHLRHYYLKLLQLCPVHCNSEVWPCSNTNEIFAGPKMFAQHLHGSLRTHTQRV